jgi:hypothetical protein
MTRRIVQVLSCLIVAVATIIVTATEAEAVFRAPSGNAGVAQCR